jgi:hypothetical protein
MIKRFLLFLGIAILAGVNLIAKEPVAINTHPSIPKKPHHAFYFFENGLPFRADVNPQEIPRIAPLISFFEHVAITLAEPLAIDFVDGFPETTESISFTPADKKKPAVIIITKEMLEKMPSQDLEIRCAKTIAHVLTHQPILSFIERFLSYANNTTKTYFALQCINIVARSINNKKITTTNNNGSRLLAYGSGTVATWVGIKCLKKLISYAKEENIKKTCCSFLKKN